MWVNKNVGGGIKFWTMSTKRQVFWSFVLAALLVGFAGLARIPDEVFVRTLGNIILAPGCLLGVMLSDSPLSVLLGLPGAVIAIGSLLCWALVSYLLLCILLPLTAALRKHRP